MTGNSRESGHQQSVRRLCTKSLEIVCLFHQLRLLMKGSMATHFMGWDRVRMLAVREVIYHSSCLDLIKCRLAATRSFPHNQPNAFAVQGKVMAGSTV